MLTEGTISTIIKCLTFSHWSTYVVILQMRIHALYRNNKYILRVMLASFVASTVVSGIIVEVNLGHIGCRKSCLYGNLLFSELTRSLALPVIALPSGNICSGVFLPHFYAFWIPLLSFESFLCILALIHGYHTYRDDSHNLKIFGGSDRQWLSDILVRDSIVYFLA